MTEIFKIKARDCDFGHALSALVDGAQIQRTGWIGAGVYLTLNDGDPAAPWSYYNQTQPERDVDPCIWMCTARGTWQPGWLPSMDDLLAGDWCVVEIDLHNKEE